MLFQDRQDANANLSNFSKGLKIDVEFRNLGMLLAKAGGQARPRPAQQIHCLSRHEAMNGVRRYVGRDETLEFLKLNPFEQTRASRSPLRVGREVVDKRVGVKKNVGGGDQIIKAHGDSMMPNSSSSAIWRSVSQSPVHFNIPADCRAMLIAGRTVTETFSCSLNGSGWAGLRTPFSYTASTVMAI